MSGQKRKRDTDEKGDEAPTKRRKSVDLSKIGNAIKRRELFQAERKEKRKQKFEDRQKRKKEAEALGEEAPKKVQITLDNTRVFDETVVQPDDVEVKAEEEQDEFAKYFQGGTVPKILITTGLSSTDVTFDFIRDLLKVIPNSVYYERRGFAIKTIVDQAKSPERGFTDVIVLNEDRKKLNALTLIHLPEGPTAYFKLSNVKCSKDIAGHARFTDHKPEVIVNNFTTRLGHRVGRMLASLFHQEPEFTGRRVATWHNQRDYIFFRHHRYIFEDDKEQDKKKAKLQEIGPRFTLKLRWLQHGTFDTQHGEFEWLWKPDMDVNRRKFYL